MIFKSKKVKRLEAEVAEVTASLQKFAAALSDTQAVLKMNLQDCVSVSRKRDVRGGVKLSFSFKKDEWAAIMSDGYALHLAAEHVIAGLMVEFEDKATRLRADGKYVLKFSLSSVPVKGQLYVTDDYGSTPLVGNAAVFGSQTEAFNFGENGPDHIDWEVCFIGSER